MPPMTTDDLYRRILDILPLATMDEDNDGQILIYTGLYQDVNDETGETLIETPNEDDSDDES